MLRALRIADLGVIGDVEIELRPGLSVVTGETGAGKTMVVTGLQLLFGGRADASRVRAGAEQATVEGLLDVSTPRGGAAQAAAVDAGATVEDGELVLRRTVTSTGRSRANVGGAAAPVSVLAAVGETVFALHGQSDQMRLARPGEQRRALDRYAGVDLADYRAAFARWQRAEAELARRTGDMAGLMRESDLLRHGIQEIEAAAPHPGEDIELNALLLRLGAADELRVAARGAHDALLGDPDNPGSDILDAATLLSTAQRQLASVQDTDPDLVELAQRLTELTAGAIEVGSELASYAEGLDADPARLAAAHERRAQLSTLVRKYGHAADATIGSIDAVLAWSAQSRARLAEVDTSDEALAVLRHDVDGARTEAARLATAIRRQRTKAATRLGDAVTVELAGLAMADASLHIQVHPRAEQVGAATLPVRAAGSAAGADGAGDSAAGPDGTEDVEFLLRPHADSPARPLSRGASGGELSRVMLALEVVLSATDPVPVMIFDEVDAGVGGRAAIEVGARLARLSVDRQVIVVTHLAQVAAFADHHFVVGVSASSATGDATSAGDGRPPVPPAVAVAAEIQRPATLTRSDVTRVDGRARLSEMARMLAGRDTPAARKHAAELLADASNRTAQDRAAATSPDHAAPTAPDPVARGA